MGKADVEAVAACSILTSQPSSPRRLGGREAESAATITWKWTVGSNTKPGSWPVKIDCGKSGKAQTSVTVR
jgi:hypothetical protein